MKSKIAAILTATAVALVSCTSGTTGQGGDSTGSAPTAVTTSSSPPGGSSVASSTSAATSSTPPADSTSPPTETAPTSSGDAYDGIPVEIPATITGANLAAAKQGVAVWRNAVRVLDQSLQDPAGKDWKPIVYRYINDPAATKQLALIDTFVKRHLHQVGDTGYTAKIFEANDHSIKIRACVDLSHVDYLDAQGSSQLVASERHVEWEIWLSQYTEPKGVWFVGLINKPKPVQPCGP